MNRRSLNFLSAAMWWLCVVQAGAEEAYVVPIDREPRHRLAYENSIVRVFDTRIAPGDTTLYHRIGERVAIDTLLRLMITRSSNFATNTLIALVGAENVTRTMRSLGAQRIQVLLLTPAMSSKVTATSC